MTEKLCNQRKEILCPSCELAVCKSWIHITAVGFSFTGIFFNVRIPLLLNRGCLLRLRRTYYFIVTSLWARNMRRSPRCRGLRGALVGPQQHFVLGGFLCATALLFHQELFKSAGGKGESLSPELHQVGVLQPGMCEAIFCSRAGPKKHIR